MALRSGSAYILQGPLVGKLDVGAAASRLDGVAQGDWAGRAVAGVGDVNADGYDDVAVGARHEGTNGVDAGSAYLVSGPMLGNLSLSLATATFRGQAAGDEAGAVVAAAGDLNGDGFADLAVSAPYNDANGVDSGAVYVFYGPVAGVFDLSLADAILLGELAGDQAGTSVRAAGDLDGDGYGDLLVGSPGHDASGLDAGAVYVVHGPLAGTQVLTAALGARLLGETPGDNAGSYAFPAGDVDADGVTDVLISARYSDLGAVDGGAAYVMNGPFVGDLSLASASARLIGVEPDAMAGGHAQAGDLDSDGEPDFVLGANFDDSHGAHAGAVFVVRGPVLGDRLLSSADLTLHGSNPDDELGLSVAVPGDLDGDGLDDVVMGAEGANRGGNNSGSIYLFQGRR